MSLKDSINRKLLKQKFWNGSESAVRENLLGMAMINPGLIVLQECQAILRKDYDHMHGKVKIITGGAAGNDPAYSGFVGPGMLTAFISGNIYSSPPCDSIFKVIQEIGTDHIPGVLAIIENRSGYRINFEKAILRAENENLNVKLILVGNEDLPKFNCSQNILFLLKIAGAMAEENKNLHEIFSVCSKIATSGEIIGINVSVQLRNECLNTSNEMEIGRGSHGESGVLKIPFSSANDAVLVLLEILLKNSKEGMENFSRGHKIAVMINNTGGCSQLETNIFAREVIQQLLEHGFLVERIYVGKFMSILDHKGFHVSLMDLSFEANVLKYLDLPVEVFTWPKSSNFPHFETIKDSAITISGKYIKENEDDLEIKAMGPSMDERTAQAFLTVITFACEAVIACADQINIMDEELGDADCGTTLSDGANAVKSAIKKRKILGVNPYVTFTQISKILEQKMGGIQGGIYSLFFQAIAMAFLECSTSDEINAYVWLNAFAAGNNVISKFGGVKEGDRTMLNPLISAQRKLENALNQNYHPIQAFGESVKAAEESAIHTIKMAKELQTSKKFNYPDPGAHAVGVWMRAAYEGVKLKFAGEYQ